MLLGAGLCGIAVAVGAQQPQYPPVPNPPPAAAAALPAPLDWAPPVLQQLSAEASTRTSFTLDRSMLGAAANLMGGDMDEPTRQAINHLDGVSVHLLRFGAGDRVDPRMVKELREGYHIRGWKHVVAAGKRGEAADGNTDVWVTMDGANVRSAVVLVQTPRELTLATVAGNLSPLDLLHLRGHFGIPRFDDGGIADRK